MGFQLTGTMEYANYVHDSFDSQTGTRVIFVDKPFFPVYVSNGSIPVGQNLTITCPLQEGHNYHIYCYGAWVNVSAAAKTDYDIYVYNPQKTLESSHTEAAGFPEHLGTTTDDSLFRPKQSGNYSFVIKNDPRESKGSQQLTFMVIETLDTDRWYSLHVEGKGDDCLPKFHTCWAYEFVTNQSKVELYVKVPQTLDMYEARLYLMNDAKSPSINAYPLPWEPGLYGNVSGRVGGYNFENEGYRGVAYASCEYMGQPMFLNYTSAVTGAKLYQLAFIGEEGSGNIEFMLKSKFDNASMLPVKTPIKVCANDAANISYVSSGSSVLEEAQLVYSVDNWISNASLGMVVSNQTCYAMIPGQEAGTLVQFRIYAKDVLRNIMTVGGNYSVKNQPVLNLTLLEDSVMLGKNVTVVGTLIPHDNASVVSVHLATSNATQTVDCSVNSDGTFTVSLKPEGSGVWAVSAMSLETPTCWRSDSELLLLNVKEPPIYVKYSLYIISALIAISAVGGVVYFFKFRGT
ncbi:MAG: hypothetical protein NWE98_01270 [Candidatus Bathyarchaeota archaeon]|nr:hypothetical protein [Candidatus Bathyarchaeota archaeon]